MSIGKALKELRKNLNISQLDLADETGITTVGISLIEKERSKAPQEKTLELISTAMGVTPNMLMLLSFEVDEIQDEEERHAASYHYDKVKEVIFKTSLKNAKIKNTP